jgi:hypothetical protein
MRKCKCGNQVADNAKACPQCGHRFTSGSVKFLGWFLLVVFVLAVIGAVNSPNTTQVSPPSVAAIPPPAPAPKTKTPAELIATRKAYAKVIDQQLLDMGIESKTYTTGAQAKTLVIDDALAGRVRGNAIRQNDELFDNLRTLGFSRLEYINGFEGDLSYDVAWTIKP